MTGIQRNKSNSSLKSNSSRQTEGKLVAATNKKKEKLGRVSLMTRQTLAASKTKSIRSLANALKTTKSFANPKPTELKPGCPFKRGNLFHYVYDNVKPFKIRMTKYYCVLRGTELRCYASANELEKSIMRIRLLEYTHAVSLALTISAGVERLRLMRKDPSMRHVPFQLQLCPDPHLQYELDGTCSQLAVQRCIPHIFIADSKRETLAWQAAISSAMWYDPRAIDPYYRHEPELDQGASPSRDELQEKSPSKLIISKENSKRSITSSNDHVEQQKQGKQLENRIVVKVRLPNKGKSVGSCSCSSTVRGPSDGPRIAVFIGDADASTVRELFEYTRTVCGIPCFQQRFSTILENKTVHTGLNHDDEDILSRRLGSSRAYLALEHIAHPFQRDAFLGFSRQVQTLTDGMNQLWYRAETCTTE